jgi:hypothetical protein
MSLVEILGSSESIHFKNCTFENNSAPLLYIRSGSPVAITDSTVRNNFLYYMVRVEGSNVDSTTCTFQGNIYNEVLVYVSGNDIYFSECILQRNIAINIQNSTNQLFMHTLFVRPIGSISFQTLHSKILIQTTETEKCLWRAALIESLSRIAPLQVSRSV